MCVDGAETVLMGVGSFEFCAQYCMLSAGLPYSHLLKVFGLDLASDVLDAKTSLSFAVRVEMRCSAVQLGVVLRLFGRGGGVYFRPEIGWRCRLSRVRRERKR